MIDYIKILKIILNEIKDKLRLHTYKLDENEFKPTNIPELKMPIFINNIFWTIGWVATVMSLLIIIMISPWNASKTNTFIFMSFITIVGIILLLITAKIDQKLNKTIDKMKIQHVNHILEKKKSIEITKTKEFLKDLNSEEIEDSDVNSLITYCYYGSSNIPVKGNLYTLPLKTILEKTNIKSVQNLYKNIDFLYKYYSQNYVEDDEYTWITKQLNAFYNSDIKEDIANAELLKHLKN